MKDNLEIGSRIRNIREGMHLSRSSFSEKINISEVFLSQVERGEKSISLNTLISICNNTGVSSDYILFGLDDSVISETKKYLKKFTSKELISYIDIIKTLTLSLRNR